MADEAPSRPGPPRNLRRPVGDLEAPRVLPAAGYMPLGLVARKFADAGLQENRRCLYHPFYSSERPARAKSSLLGTHARH